MRLADAAFPPSPNASADRRSLGGGGWTRQAIVVAIAALMVVDGGRWTIVVDDGRWTIDDGRSTIHAASGQRISIRTEDGLTLSGAYYEPSRRPAPGIVLLHMLRRTHEDWDATASQLADAGFAVVAIDFRGAGEDVSQLAIDVRSAKAFLREKPDVLPNSIGIAGASIGANLAVIDAAADPGVRSIALLSPGLDYRGLRTEAAMKAYAGRPALLVGSTRDPYGWRSIRQLATVGPGTREVRLTETIAHGTVLLSRDPDLISTLVDWFRRTLL